MPVPTTIADLNVTASLNSPAGSEAIGTSLDDYIRSHGAIIKQHEADLAATSIGKGSALIGFILSGAGAVARTVLSKLHDMDITPYDFGGLTDAAIQLAHTHVKANGGVLKLPPGTFDITALVLTGATVGYKIKGAGRTATVLRRASDAVGTLIVGSGLSSVKVELEDFKIDCRHSTFPNGNHGISVADSNGFRVRRVDVVDYKNSAILFSATVANTYSDCVAEDCVSDGLDAANNGMLCADLDKSGFVNCRALNVGKTGSPCYGLQLKNSCQDGFIINGYTSDATIGFAVGNYDLSGTHKNNRIIGGAAFNCDTGLAFGTALGDYVSGLVIDMNGAGQNAVDFQGNSVGNTVRGVAIKNLAASKLAVNCRSGDTDNTVEIDTIENASGVAGARFQFLSGSLRNYVSLNRFVNPTTVTDSNTLVSDASTGGTNVFEYRSLPNKQSATIASDAIGLRHGRISRVIVDTEAAAATDNLATINNGADGQTITISQLANARDVTVKHGTGNIKLTGSADFVWTSASQTLTLTYNSALASWLEVSRGTAA